MSRCFKLWQYGLENSAGGETAWLFGASCEEEMCAWVDDLRVALLSLRRSNLAEEELVLERAMLEAYRLTKAALSRPCQPLASAEDALQELVLSAVHESAITTAVSSGADAATVEMLSVTAADVVTFGPSFALSPSYLAADII